MFLVSLFNCDAILFHLLLKTDTKNILSLTWRNLIQILQAFKIAVENADQYNSILIFFLFLINNNLMQLKHKKSNIYFMYNCLPEREGGT